MQDPRQVVIISVPYCEPLLLVAPVLLASCLEKEKIPAIGIDFNALFLDFFADKTYYTELKNFLTMGHLFRPEFDRGVFREVMKFSKNFLLDVKKKYDPAYIGISIFTGESHDFGLVLSYLIRRYLPDVKIIAGGKGLEVNGANHEKIYKTWIDHGIVDCIVVGDAESAIVDAIKNDQVGIVFARSQTKEDLDDIPLAKWDDYDFGIYQKLAKKVDRAHADEEPYLTVTASKGCVRQCTFCDVVNFWPKFIYRDPVKVANEIIHNYRKTGIKRFKFTDNLINGSVTNFRAMNQVLVNEIPHTIDYGGYAIFRGKHQMPEEDFDLASRAGNTRWGVGVESGSEKIRYEMKKKFDNDDLDWSVNMLYKYDIHQNWLLMVGYPSETEQDFIETKKLIQRYAHMKDKISVQVTPTFMLLDNSPLITNDDLANNYGLQHIGVGAFKNKFWTSTKFTDNTYPVRSRRWKELINLIQEKGYRFGPGMPLEKWAQEVEHFDRIYSEQRTKIIPIYRTS